VRGGSWRLMTPFPGTSAPTGSNGVIGYPWNRTGTDEQGTCGLARRVYVDRYISICCHFCVATASIFLMIPAILPKAMSNNKKITKLMARVVHQSPNMIPIGVKFAHCRF